MNMETTPQGVEDDKLPVAEAVRVLGSDGEPVAGLELGDEQAVPPTALSFEDAKVEAGQMAEYRDKQTEGLRD